MKKLLLLLFILSVGNAKAQIKVKINGKPYTETATMKAEDIKTMEVAFDKPKKLNYYGLGRLSFMVELFNDKDEIFEKYYFTKDGANSIEAFLDDVNVYMALPTQPKDKTVFYGTIIRNDDHLDAKFRYAGQWYDAKTVKIKIFISFRDKVGYEKYGDLVFLIKPQTFTFDNTNYFTEGQKQKEIDKAASDAKKAEQDKVDVAAKIEAEAKEKKKKRGGLLNSVLNKI